MSPDRRGAVSVIPLRAAPASRLDAVVGAERMDEVRRLAGRAARRLGGGVLWHVSSTARGGGVAELLHTLLPYSLDLGIESRWAVIEAPPDFFAVTKRLCLGLYGWDGGGPLDQVDGRLFAGVSAELAGGLSPLIGGRDVVIVHDPQPAGMIPALAARARAVIWRCHVGADAANAATRASWSFLLPWLDRAGAFVFSCSRHVPDWASGPGVFVVPPSIDPFSPKNAELDDGLRGRLLAAAGLGPDGGPGSLVVQVARWDRMKDMPGVMAVFAGALAGDQRSRLALVGPDPCSVPDDPEGALTHAECVGAWRRLPPGLRGRVSLISLPAEDVERNALIVNAIQRRADVVVQKSIAEGFGLTVTEAMWKARPVVASAVGGIRDQVVDAESGVLVADPYDLAAFGLALRRLVEDPDRRERLGEAGRRRVRERFLDDSQLAGHAAMLCELLS